MDTLNLASRIMALYDEGCSDLRICKEMGITHKKFLAYMERSDGFRELIEQGREAAQNFWEEQSRMNLNNKDFNTPLYKMNMQQRYGWSDKTENKAQAISRGDIERMKQELANELPNMLKLVESPKQKVLEHHNEESDIDE